MSSYNTIPSASAEQPPQTQRKNDLGITDPGTVENNILAKTEDKILLTTLQRIKENPKITETDTFAAFAAEVAEALTKTLSNERLSNSPSIENTKVFKNDGVLCRNKIKKVDNTEVDGSDISDNISLGNLADVENSSDVKNVDKCRNINVEEPAGISLKQNSDLNRVNAASYGREKCISPMFESIPTTEYWNSNINSLIDKKLDTFKTMILSNQDDTSESEKSVNYENAGSSNNFIQTKKQIIHKPIHEIQPIVPQLRLNVEENKRQKNVADVSGIQATVSSESYSKCVTKSKKNKTKKKKIAKSEKSKKLVKSEGGKEMEAFLDNEKQNPNISSILQETVPVKKKTIPLSLLSMNNDNEKIIAEPGKSLPDNMTSNNICSSVKLLSDSIPRNNVSSFEQPIKRSSISPPESDDKRNVDEPAQNKTVLKYNYKEDQWSPLNPEGKKQYDMEFLLQIQSQPISLTKPSNLPNLDIIKDKPHIQKLNLVNRDIQRPPPPLYGDHFLPTYAQRGVPRMPQMNYNNRRSLQGREQKAKEIISLSHNVKLHEADNAWKSAYEQDTSADVKDPEIIVSDEEETLRNSARKKKIKKEMIKLKNQEKYAAFGKMVEVQIKKIAFQSERSAFLAEKMIKEILVYAQDGTLNDKILTDKFD